jgi:pSer/pThr/pTyr-binding forkhead associated (FHA) protein
VSEIILLAIRLGIVILFLVFIGWIGYIIWIDFNRKDIDVERISIPPMTLRFADQQSERVEFFTRPVITIGRDPTCDCILYDKSVSSRQTRLSFHHNQWWVEDLNSTNGTFLNREKITQPTVVISDDEISCGSTHILLQIGTPLS